MNVAIDPSADVAVWLQMVLACALVSAAVGGLAGWPPRWWLCPIVAINTVCSLVAVQAFLDGRIALAIGSGFIASIGWVVALGLAIHARRARIDESAGDGTP